MIALLDAIQKVCKELHVPMAQDVFGEPGVDAVFKIMETVKSLFKHVEPERVKGRIIVFRRVLGQEGVATSPPLGASANFAGWANSEITDLVLEIAANGLAYQQETPIDLGELVGSAVVYAFESGGEFFFAGAQKKAVIQLDPAARSQFAVPTFSNLRDALERYAHENVRESTCKVFEQAWNDANRLFFKAKPEARMRDSLTQFLRNRLGADYDVWPEQNVDESHPVDIQIKPRFADNRLMLVEIKWLGKSVASDGHITAWHGVSRAQSGADQLAEYLDAKRKFAPTSVIQGYYVIIDGRRNNLHEGVTTLQLHKQTPRSWLRA